MKPIFIILVTLLVGGCTSIPKGIKPVTGFEKQRYLGKWYEIARLDHSFERDMISVTADYSFREDGGIRVLNKGFDTQTNEWGDAEGRAYFVGNEETAHLKVSFFGPFYGSYVIFKLDTEHYQYAYVCGPNKNFLWFLARTPEVSDEQKADFIEVSQDLGFATESIIWVSHDTNTGI